MSLKFVVNKTNHFGITALSFIDGTFILTIIPLRQLFSPTSVHAYNYTGHNYKKLTIIHAGFVHATIIKTQAFMPRVILSTS